MSNYGTGRAGQTKKVVQTLPQFLLITFSIVTCHHSNIKDIALNIAEEAGWPISFQILLLIKEECKEPALRHT